MKKQTEPKPKTESAKPHLSEEERLQRARARHAEEAARLEKRSAVLTQKAVARKKDEQNLAEDRIAASVAAGEVAKSEAKAKADRATLAQCNARIRHGETRLGLRKRGQAPVEVSPAEIPSSPQEPTSGDAAVSEEGGDDA